MPVLHLRLIRSALLFLALLILGNGACWAQEATKLSLSGRTLSKQDGKPVSGVILLLEFVSEGSEKPRQLTYAQSRSDGTFHLAWPKVEKAGHLQLSVRRLGYAPQVLPLRSLEGDLTLLLVPQEIRLKQVQVRSPMIRSRGDTTSYSASRLTSAATYTLEDLIKRIPALQVDKHGVIRFNDKPIEGLHIEGMNLLGGRYAVATRNLKAEDIASIDLIERFQKMKFLRGKEAGEGTILNVHLKSRSKLRPVGEVQAFGGLEQGQPQEALYGGKAMTFLARAGLQTLALAGANHGSASIASEGLEQRDEGLLGVSSLIGGVKADEVGGRSHLAKGNIGATLNGIHQLRDDEHTLRYNLGYEGTHLGTYHLSAVRQLDQGTTSHFTEEHPTQGRRHLLQSLLDYTANTSKQYFQELLSLHLSDTKRQTALRRNAQPIDLLASQASYQLRSQTSWAKGTAQGGRLSLSGDLQLSALPSLRFHSPTPALAFDTHLSGYSLQLSTSTQYSHRLPGRWSLAGGIDFLGHYGALQASERISQPTPYEVQGGGLSIQTAPTLSYLGTSTDFTLSLPLTLLLEGYRYGEAGRQAITPLLRLFPGVTAQLRHRFSPELKVIVKAGYQANLRRSLATFLLTPLRLGYDQVRHQRDAELLAQRSLSTHLTCYYHRPLEGFNASFTAGWRRSFSPYSQVEDLRTGQRLQQSVKQESVQDLYTAHLMLSKLWSEINTTASLQASASLLQRPIIRQGERLSTTGGGYSFAPSLSLAPWSWVSLDCEGSLQVSLLSTPYYRSQTTIWSVSPSLSLHPLQYWFASLSVESSWSDLPSGSVRPLHYLRASLRYQGRRWTVKLSGENLLNEVEQFTSSYSPLDEYLLYTRLRPRSIQLSVSWRY